MRMNAVGRGKQERQGVGEKQIYSRDPLARLLLGRLGLSQLGMALAVLAWGVLYVFVLPAVFGSLRSADGYLGSLGDWHAQLLIFLVFPAACAFYAWQPRAIDGVYKAMRLRWSLLEVGKGYRSRLWPFVSVSVALGVVLFDLPKMATQYGSWWMTENLLTILGREASLAVAFYMLSMIAWRHAVSTGQWRRSFAGPAPVTGLKAASAYQLILTLLLALLGLRLSIEGIELPHRAGAITPDYYFKIAAYILLSLLCFFAPLWGAFRSGSMSRAHRLALWLAWAGIAALPLPAFVLLRLAFGP